MKSIHLFCCVGLLLCLFIGSSSCQTTPKRTTLFLQDTLDLGVVMAGQKKEAVIAIHNPTDQYVTIESIRGDCNCVNINTCPTRLSANEKAQITITYDSERDKEVKGLLYKAVLLKASTKPYLQTLFLKAIII